MSERTRRGAGGGTTRPDIASTSEHVATNNDIAIRVIERMVEDHAEDVPRMRSYLQTGKDRPAAQRGHRRNANRKFGPTQPPRPE